MLPVLETGTGERIDRPPQGASPTEPISKATEHEGGPILAATSAEVRLGHGPQARTSGDSTSRRSQAGTAQKQGLRKKIKPI